MEIFFNDLKIILNPDKAIYVPKWKTLLMSDIHLGKAQHFRKNGIAIPAEILKVNIARMQKLLDTYRPKELYILGDLFHSEENLSIDYFSNFLSQNSSLDVTLITGNHDKHSLKYFSHLPIKIVDELNREGIWLVHNYEDVEENKNKTIISGHIHPCIKMKLKGMRSERLECFFIRKEHMILPAFGEFTGNYTMQIKKTDSVFVIAEDDVLQLS